MANYSYTIDGMEVSDLMPLESIGQKFQEGTLPSSTLLRKDGSKAWYPIDVVLQENGIMEQAPPPPPQSIPSSLKAPAPAMGDEPSSSISSPEEIPPPPPIATQAPPPSSTPASSPQEPSFISSPQEQPPSSPLSASARATPPPFDSAAGPAPSSPITSTSVAPAPIQEEPSPPPAYSEPDTVSDSIEEEEYAEEDSSEEYEYEQEENSYEEDYTSSEGTPFRLPSLEIPEHHVPRPPGLKHRKLSFRKVIQTVEREMGLSNGNGHIPHTDSIPEETFQTPAVEAEEPISEPPSFSQPSQPIPPQAVESHSTKSGSSPNEGTERAVAPSQPSQPSQPNPESPSAPSPEPPVSDIPSLSIPEISLPDPVPQEQAPLPDPTPEAPSEPAPSAAPAPDIPTLQLPPDPVSSSVPESPSSPTPPEISSEPAPAAGMPSLDLPAAAGPEPVETTAPTKPEPTRRRDTTPLEAPPLPPLASIPDFHSQPPPPPNPPNGFPPDEEKLNFTKTDQAQKQNTKRAVAPPNPPNGFPPDEEKLNFTKTDQAQKQNTKRAVAPPNPPNPEPADPSPAVVPPGTTDPSPSQSSTPQPRTAARPASGERRRRKAMDVVSMADAPLPTEPTSALYPFSSPSSGSVSTPPAPAPSAPPPPEPPAPAPEFQPSVPEPASAPQLTPAPQPEPASSPPSFQEPLPAPPAEPASPPPSPQPEPSPPPSSMPPHTPHHPTNMLFPDFSEAPPPTLGSPEFQPQEVAPAPSLPAAPTETPRVQTSQEEVLSVIESFKAENTSVEVIQYNRLAGSADIRTGTTLFYLHESGMRLKQIKILLNQGAVHIEAGALHFMKGNIEMTSGVEGVGGLAQKITSGVLTQEKAIKPRYEGTGEMFLEPSFGHFIVVDLSGENVIVDKGMFYASDAGVSIGVEVQKNISSALFGGEGLFQTKLSGKGWAVLVSPVPSREIIRYKLNNERLHVDGDFTLLRKGNIRFSVEKSSKGIFGTMASGEGLLQTFSGTGEVWIAPSKSVYDGLRQFGATFQGVNPEQKKK